MCGIDFGLVLMDTLLKDTVLRDGMDHGSNYTKWVDKMWKMSRLGWVLNFKKEVGEWKGGFGL